ncbi:CRISPR-associated endonuclease Cas2 [Oscillospiraceae bacterium HV4-5-C5C]|nr:CRISPR-associated endonuclease Cas2 [Oscillospiraceae bacterium HV4-5-C5C]
MYSVLVYDIGQENGGKKRLPKIFKVCKKYLNHVQNSVFEGELSESQKMALLAELKSLIDKRQDSVIFFYTRNEKWLSKEFWGQAIDQTSQFL